MANNDNSELLQAFKMFGEASKSYGLSRAINQANEQAQQIKITMTDDMERRRALSDLADSISIRMAGAGAEGQHIAAVAQSIKPVMASTAEQAVMIGAQTGDKQMMQMGQDVIDQAEKKKLAFLEAQANNQFARDKALYGYQDALQDKRLAAQEEREYIKQKKAGKPLPMGEMSKINGIDENAEQLKGILNKLETGKFNDAVGPVDGRWPSALMGADNAAFQADLGRYAATYVNSITGAGVSNTERATLMANIPTIKDHPAQVKKKIEEMLKSGSRIRNRKLTNYKAGGYNIGELEHFAPDAFTPTGGQASTDPSSVAVQARSFWKPKK